MQLLSIHSLFLIRAAGYIPAPNVLKRADALVCADFVVILEISESLKIFLSFFLTTETRSFKGEYKIWLVVYPYLRFICDMFF